jgi:hypothetical protein
LPMRSKLFVSLVLLIVFSLSVTGAPSQVAEEPVVETDANV